jgi:hypothetical protein
VPIVARIVWADDGEAWIDTVALGWSGGGLVYVRDVRNRLRPHRHVAPRCRRQTSLSE